MLGIPVPTKFPPNHIAMINPKEVDCASYGTVPCEKFAKQLWCPYGHRCHFGHNYLLANGVALKAAKEYYKQKKRLACVRSSQPCFCDRNHQLMPYTPLHKGLMVQHDSNPFCLQPRQFKHTLLGEEWYIKVSNLQCMVCDYN